MVATLLQASLPHRVGQTRWIFVGISIVLLVVFAFVNPRQIERRHQPLRGVMLVLVGLLSLGNAIAGAQLVIDLVNSEGIRDPGTLLRTGGAIWLTNVIVFSLWYWLFDRGGPYARGHDDIPVPRGSSSRRWQAGRRRPSGWRPEYVDYLYLSFTNALGVQPHRRHAAQALGEAHDARAVVGVTDDRDPGDRAGGQHPPLKFNV